MNLNRAMIIGNLTRDPEVRTTPNGQTVCSFSVATSHVWKDANNQKQEKTEFHNLVAWAKLAEICGQFLSKGRKVYVEGRLQTREWVGQDGAKRNRTEIVVDNMIMLDRAPGASGSGVAVDSGGVSSAAGSPLSGSTYVPVSQAPERVTSSSAADDEIKVEDIPF